MIADTLLIVFQALVYLMMMGAADFGLSLRLFGPAYWILDASYLFFRLSKRPPPGERRYGQIYAAIIFIPPVGFLFYDFFEWRSQRGG